MMDKPLILLYCINFVYVLLRFAIVPDPDRAAALPDPFANIFKEQMLGLWTDLMAAMRSFDARRSASSHSDDLSI